MAAALLGLVCGTARAIDYLSPTTLKVGQNGKFVEYASAEEVDKVNYLGFAYKLDEVLSEKEALVRAHKVNKNMTVSKDVTMRFIVEMDTKGLADGAALNLDGIWEVKETRKIDKKTYYVLKSVKKEEKENKE